MGLAENVRRVRYEKGLSPGDLADAAGISRTALYQIERGETGCPRVKTAQALAKALGVSCEVLFEGSDWFPRHASTPSEMAELIEALPKPEPA